MTEAIADDKVVLIHYTLTAPDGQVIDSSADGPALPYLHGAGNLVPGLERALDGRAVGDSFEVTVAAKDGYGERDKQAFAVPRGQFPPDVELEAGMDFVMEDAQGNHHPLWIAKVQDDVVLVDPNHPLSGMDLHFAIEIVSLRDATAEELDHGHPHGPDGSHAH